jgi:hypothetical protein
VVKPPFRQHRLRMNSGVRPQRPMVRLSRREMVPIADLRQFVAFALSCSAMPISQTRPGWAFLKVIVWVEAPTSWSTEERLMSSEAASRARRRISRR